VCEAVVGGAFCRSSRTAALFPEEQLVRAKVSQGATPSSINTSSGSSRASYPRLGFEILPDLFATHFWSIWHERLMRPYASDDPATKSLGRGSERSPVVVRRNIGGFSLRSKGLTLWCYARTSAQQSHDRLRGIFCSFGPFRPFAGLSVC
jgi:hypothetical protein